MQARPLPEVDNDEFADYFCEWENPDDPPYRLVPLEAGMPFCLVDFLDDPSVDYQYSSLFDFNPFGEWMELMMNANMNNGVATAWYRDVDDTTGEPTSAWSKLPWNFGRGSGSTVFGLPFTSLEAAGFFVWGSSEGMATTSFPAIRCWPTRATSTVTVISTAMTS